MITYDTFYKHLHSTTSTTTSNSSTSTYHWEL